MGESLKIPIARPSKVYPVTVNEYRCLRILTSMVFSGHHGRVRRHRGNHRIQMDAGAVAAGARKLHAFVANAYVGYVAS